MTGTDQNWNSVVGNGDIDIFTSREWLKPNICIRARNPYRGMTTPLRLFFILLPPKHFTYFASISHDMSIIGSCFQVTLVLHNPPTSWVPRVLEVENHVEFHWKFQTNSIVFLKLWEKVPIQFQNPTPHLPHRHTRVFNSLPNQVYWKIDYVWSKNHVHPTPHPAPTDTQGYSTPF